MAWAKTPSSCSTPKVPASETAPAPQLGDIAELAPDPAPDAGLLELVAGDGNVLGSAAGIDREALQRFHGGGSAGLDEAVEAVGHERPELAVIAGVLDRLEDYR